MKKQTIVNLLSNIIAMTVSFGVSFILTPYLINSIGKEAYSFYPLSNNFISYVSIITMALNSMVSRFITIEVVKRNLQKAQEYFSSVFLANCILSGILLIPMIVFVKYLEVFLKIPPQIVLEIKIMFSLNFLAMLINIVSSVFGVATFVENRIDLKAQNDIFQSVLKCLLYFLMFYLYSPSMIFIGITVLILSITNFIVQVYFTRKLLPNYRISFKFFNIRLISELLTSGVWNSINSLGMTLLLNVSLLIANIKIGAKAAGDLSIVQTLPSIMTTIITTVYTVFLPQLTRSYVIESKSGFIKTIQDSQKILSVISTVPVLMIIMFGKEFFSLWVPGEDAAYLQQLAVVTIVPLFVHANMWTIYCLNIVLNKIRIPCYVLICVGILNLITVNIIMLYAKDLILIPLVSSGFNIVYYLCFIPVYASRQLKTSCNLFYKNIIKTVIFSVIYVACIYLLKNYFTIHSWGTFFYTVIPFGLAGVLIHGFMTFSKEDINGIFQRKGR